MYLFTHGSHGISAFHRVILIKPKLFDTICTHHSPHSAHVTGSLACPIIYIVLRVQCVCIYCFVAHTVSRFVVVVFFLLFIVKELNFIPT